MLGKVLRAQRVSQQAFLETIAPIATYPWFLAEFISAGGPGILALRRASNMSITITTNFLLSATSYDSIRLSVSCTITILMTEGNKPKKSGSDEPIPTGNTYSNFDRMAGLLVTLLNKWKNDRQGSSSSGGARELMPANGEDEGEELLRYDANLWSSDQWVNLREDIEEAILGLRRRYIMPAASVERQRFVRDPDGICSLL